jgi:outer membrane protein OmpA-like peptidoglycan-associated protein
MNTRFPNQSHYARVLTVAAAVGFTLAGCATAPVSPDGAAEVRAKLTRLQADPNLATRAPVALSEAEAAVSVAEQPAARDAALAAHRVYMADRKVEIAMAQAATRFDEDQRVKLGEERERARLAARTREADAARADAEATRASAADAALLASAAADSSRILAENAAREAALKAEDMQRQIDALQAKTTERGIVLTLGDVLFTSGKADLKAGAANNLDKLVQFLDHNPDRNVEIEGHTDNVGGDEYNQELSQRRADSVRTFLMQKGIGPDRIVASGKGEHQPVSDNDSEGGRQQNRRVEVIIGNPPAVVASARHTLSPDPVGRL